MGEQYICSDPGHLPGLFRARHCYSLKLAEHNSSEGTVFLVTADSFFPLQMGENKFASKMESKFKTSKMADKYLLFSEAFD